MGRAKRIDHVIAVRDLDAAILYYEGVLGFRVEERGAEGWRWFLKDAVSIMCGHCPEEVEAGTTNNHSYFLRVTLDEVDSYCADNLAKGGDICNELSDKQWGFREFGVRMNEGHRILYAKRL